MTAIGNDAAISDTSDLGELNEHEAGEELLRRFMPDEGKDAAQQPSKKKTDEAKTDDADPEPTDADDASADDQPEANADDEGNEGDEAKKTIKKYAEEADTYMKIKVGDEEHEVPVRDLSRLYGQEAALTKKSMEVSEQRKAAEADLAKQTAASAALLERARERFTPYSKLDFNLLATQLAPEDYTALRQSAQAAWEDVQFLERHVDGFMTAVKEKQTNERVERAKECLKVLSGPADKGGIEGWSQKVYDDIRAFAITEGAPTEVINELVEPWAIKLIHNAMQYARGRDKAPVITKKVNKTPTKITKTTSSPASEKGSADASKRALSKLQESGQTDDAAEALMARWGARDKD
jgi:hypothetical protein